MAIGGAGQDDIRFSATFEDNVSPEAAALQAKLKELGATEYEIKLMLRAYDEASPKIKEAQEAFDRLPKEHMMQIQADTKGFRDRIEDAKKSLADGPLNLPVTVKSNFDEWVRGVKSQIDEVGQSIDKVFGGFYQRIPLGLGGLRYSSGGLLGPLGLAAGAGVTGGAALTAQSLRINSQMEQSLITLTQVLKDNTQAQQEVGTLVEFAKKTPFAYQDVLSADVRLRSYGIDPQGRVGLDKAGDMAAALNTPITQAVEAIADARQGYFIRMLSYGVRLLRSDFQKGGKYQGLTYEEGVEKSVARFAGAMEAQSRTLQGITSNIKDIVEQNFVRRLTSNDPTQQSGLYGIIREQAIGLESRLDDPDFQRKLGEQVEKVQKGFADLWGIVQRGKSYFDTHLANPLKEITNSVLTVGKAFYGTFGRTTIAGLETVGQALTAILEPLSKMAAKFPEVADFFGFVKGLEQIGVVNDPFGGPFKFITQLPKVGLALLARNIIETVDATRALNNAFEDVDQSGEAALDRLHSRISLIAGGIGEATAELKIFAAEAASILPDTASVSKRADFAAAAAEKFGIAQSQGFGDQFSQLALEEIQRGYLPTTDADTLTRAADRTSQAVRALAEALNVELGPATEMVAQAATLFGPQLAKMNANNVRGQSIAGQYAGLLAGRPIPDELLGAGMTNWTEILTSALGQAAEPSVEQVRSLVDSGRLKDFYNLRQNALTGPNYNAALSTIGDFQAGVQADRRTEEQLVQRLTKAAGGFPIKVPQIGDLAGRLGFDFKPEDIKTTEGIAETWIRVSDAADLAQEKFDKANIAVGRAQAVVEEIQQAMSYLNNELTKYQYENVVPIQRAQEDWNHVMAKTSDRIADISFALGEANYRLSKFQGGLLTGEQAALDNIHALEVYNKQLEYLRTLHTGMMSDLTRTTFREGFTSVVKPIMGFTLEKQIQEAQRRERLARLEYELGYGEQHYQIEQAARPIEQTQEMSFKTRIQGVREERSQVDRLRASQRQLNREQHAQQVQTRIYRDQLYETSVEMRKFADAQFALGQEAFKANNELLRSQKILGRLERFRDELKAQKESLGRSLYDFITFDITKLEEWSNVVRGIWDGTFEGLAEKQREPNEQAANLFVSTWKQATNQVKGFFTGLFTGETFTRITDVVSHAFGSLTRSIGLEPGPIGTGLGLGAAGYVVGGSLKGLGALAATPFRHGAAKLAGGLGASDKVIDFLKGAPLLSRIAEGFQPMKMLRGATFTGGAGALGALLGGPVLGGLAALGTSFTSFGSGERRILKPWMKAPIAGIGTAGRFLSKAALPLALGLDATSVAFGDDDERRTGLFGLGGAGIGAGIGMLGGPLGMAGGAALGSLIGWGASKVDWSKVGDNLKSAGKATGKWLKNAGKDAGKWIGKAAKDTAKWLKGAGKWILNAGKDVGRWLKNAGRFVLNALKDAGKWVLNRFKDAGNFVWNKIKGAAGKVRDAADFIWDKITGAFKWVKENILDKIPTPGKILDKGKGIVGDVVGGVSGAAEDAKNFLGLAGGIDRVPYDGYPAVLHQDEMVVQAGTANNIRNAQKEEDIVRRREYEKRQRDLKQHHKQVEQYSDEHKRKRKNVDDRFIKETDRNTERHHSEYERKFSSHQTKIEQILRIAQGKQKVAYDYGWRAIYRVQETWIKKIKQSLRNIDQNIGLTSGGDNAKDNAAGSFVKGDKYDKRGTLIRVGEEGFDEVVIPLAPHRRDRARNLLQQVNARIGAFANGGVLASHGLSMINADGRDPAYETMSKMVMGFAAGGYSSAAKNVIEQMLSQGKLSGHTSGLQPGLKMLAKVMNSLFGLDVISGLRPGSIVAGSDRLSNHAWGGAIDLATEIGMPDIRTMDSDDPRISVMDKAHAFLSRYFEPISKDFLWRTMTGGNHFDHIHFGMQEQYAYNPENLAAYISDLFGGVSVKQLLKGLKAPGGIMIPNVPEKLKKMGPVGKLLYNVLQRKKKQWMRAGGGDDSLSGIAGSGRKLMQRISRAEGWDFSDWWELDRRESTHGQDLVNESSTARLRGQFLDFNWGKYGPGSDPRKNPSMRQQIMSMARYIAERYGNPTAALLHHDRNNWYAGGRREVPYDGYPAVLHKGERVKTAGEARYEDSKSDNDPDRKHLRNIDENMSKVVDFQRKQTGLSEREMRERIQDRIRGGGKDSKFDLNRLLGGLKGLMRKGAGAGDGVFTDELVQDVIAKAEPQLKPLYEEFVKLKEEYKEARKEAKEHRKEAMKYFKRIGISKKDRKRIKKAIKRGKPRQAAQRAKRAARRAGATKKQVKKAGTVAKRAAKSQRDANKIGKELKGVAKEIKKVEKKLSKELIKKGINISVIKEAFKAILKSVKKFPNIDKTMKKTMQNVKKGGKHAQNASKNSKKASSNAKNAEKRARSASNNSKKAANHANQARKNSQQAHASSKRNRRSIEEAKKESVKSHRKMSSMNQEMNKDHDQMKKAIKRMDDKKQPIIVNVPRQVVNVHNQAKGAKLNTNVKFQVTDRKR